MQVREQRLVVTYQRPSSVTSFRVGPRTESDHTPHTFQPLLYSECPLLGAEPGTVTQPIGVNYKVV
jgi:hypothetical protein